MTIRIPSSLKWLINRRARLQGEILKAKARLSEQIAAEESLIEVLNSDLTTIDLAIRLHEIPLDPTTIPPINTRVTSRRFAHGEITRAIFAALRKSENVPL